MSDSSCSCGHAENTQDLAPETLILATTPANAGDPTGEAAECPVIAGTPVSKSEAEAKGLYRGYEGQRYWLCGPGCGPKCDADPARYTHAGW